MSSDQPRPVGVRAPIHPVDVVVLACELFAFVSLAIWGFVAWPSPWNLVFGIGTPLVAIALWVLFASPRAIIRLHPFVRAPIELLIYAAATIAWWDLGLTWVGVTFAAIAVAAGLVAGLRSLP